MSSAEPDQTDLVKPDASGDCPPRAFAQGTGILLQTAGVLLFLSATCACPMTGVADPVWSRGEVIGRIENSEPLGMSVEGLLDQPARAGVMLTVMSCVVGGLAVAVSGLGLQADRPGGARFAVVSTTGLLVVLLLAGVGLWVGEAGIGARAGHAGIVLLVAILMGFSWVARAEVRRTPPPPGVDELPGDYKVPYSHYHDDPPQVRLAKEIAARKKKLEYERLELEKLERELSEDKNPH